MMTQLLRCVYAFRTAWTSRPQEHRTPDRLLELERRLLSNGRYGIQSMIISRLVLIYEPYQSLHFSRQIRGAKYIQIVFACWDDISLLRIYVQS